MTRKRRDCRRRITELVAALGEAALAAASAAEETSAPPRTGSQAVRAYVTHFGASDTSVIDPYERHVLATIQTGRQLGMQTLDQNLQELVQRNMVSASEARNAAANKDNFPG